MARPQIPDDLDPCEAAAAALSALIATGPTPDQVTDAIGGMVSRWADEPDIDGSIVLSRLEALWDGFSTEAAALHEQLDEAEGTAAAVQQARRVMAALDAAVATLAAISARAG